MRIVFNKVNDSTEVDIFGDIGESWFSEGNTLETVKAQFDSVDTPNLIINVASFGGLISEGLAIHDLIKSFEGKTTAKIVGWTASMGTIVALAADEVEISENSYFLVHNAWSGLSGNAKQLKEEAQELERLDQRLASIYANKTGKSVDEVLDLMAEEKWITPEEAMEFGFVDSITEPKKAAAKFSNKELNKAGLPLIPNNITNKIEEMENNSITEKLDTLKDWIVDTFQAKAVEGETEVMDALNKEVQDKLAAYEQEATIVASNITTLEEVVSEKDAEIIGLNAKVSELEATISAASAEPTALAVTEEPALGNEVVLTESQAALKAILSK